MREIVDLTNEDAVAIYWESYDEESPRDLPLDSFQFDLGLFTEPISEPISEAERKKPIATGYVHHRFSDYVENCEPEVVAFLERRGYRHDEAVYRAAVAHEAYLNRLPAILRRVADSKADHVKVKVRVRVTPTAVCQHCVLPGRCGHCNCEQVTYQCEHCRRPHFCTDCDCKPATEKSTMTSQYMGEDPWSS